MRYNYWRRTTALGIIICIYGLLILSFYNAAYCVEWKWNNRSTYEQSFYILTTWEENEREGIVRRLKREKYYVPCSWKNHLRERIWHVREIIKKFPGGHRIRKCSSNVNGKYEHKSNFLNSGYKITYEDKAKIVGVQDSSTNGTCQTT